MDRRPFAWGIVALAAVVVAQSARADIAFPKEIPQKKSQGVEAPLVVSVDARATENRLLIPKKLLGKANRTAAAQQESSMPTIIAGLALSLALASLVFMRGRSRAVKVAASVAVLLTAGFVAVQIAGANAPPIERPPTLAPPIEAAGQSVVIEIVEKGDAVRFIRAGRPHIRVHVPFSHLSNGGR